MALPIVKHTVYSTKLKGYGDIKFRHFIQSEQKALMTAVDLGDENAVFNTLVDIVKSCVKTKIDIESLTEYELEYLFLQIYVKSVQNKIEGTYSCQGIIKKDEVPNQEDIESTVKDDVVAPESLDETDIDNDDIDIPVDSEGVSNEEYCNAEFKITIPIENATIKYPDDFDKLSEVKIGDDAIIRLKKPTAINAKDIEQQYVELTKVDDDNEPIEHDTTDLDMLFIFSHIKEIEDLGTNDKSIPFTGDDESKKQADEFTFDEFKNWFGDLGTHDVGEIMKYVKAKPVLYYKHVIKCPKCKTEKEIEFTGISSFFQ